jgi:CBS domain containing-hemolysin-like protein
MSDLSTQLAGAQLGVTMASLGLGFVAEPAVEHLYDRTVGGLVPEGARHVVGLVLALALVAFLHLVLGEMVPKSLSLAAPDTALRWLVLPYRAFLRLFRPAIRGLNALAFAGCRLLGVEPRRELVAVHSASELAAIVNTSSEEGVIEAEDARLLSGALAFALRPVGEITTPLAELATVRFGATAAQVERVVAASGQERVPILGTEPQRPVIGYVHARDLLAIPTRERLSPLSGEAVRSMAIVRAERSLIEVLRTLRRVQRQMAVVTGDGGTVLGVVSVEEVVRALMAPSAGEPEPSLG